MSHTSKEVFGAHSVKATAPTTDLPDLPNLSDIPDIADVGRQASAMISARVRDDPYATLGIALGLGLLIGGGMWRLVARSVLGLGTRVVLGAVTSSIVKLSLPAHQQENRP